MKIAGLTLPQFAGAIIVGLIVSFVLITLLVPTDVKPETPKPVVTKSCGAIGMSSAWNTTFCDINDTIENAYQMMLILLVALFLLPILMFLLQRF
jgi:hypothetical protein